MRHFIDLRMHLCGFIDLRMQVSCPYCNGTGYVTQHMGGFYMQSTCGRCGGTGSFNKNPCLDCEGHGRSVQRRTVTVQVPAGINDGETVRMPMGKVRLIDNLDYRN